MTQTATTPTIQRCTLTDEQLRQHADNHRKLARWVIAPDIVQETAAGITAAIEELLSFRAAEREGQL